MSKHLDSHAPCTHNSYQNNCLSYWHYVPLSLRRTNTLTHDKVRARFSCDVKHSWTLTTRSTYGTNQTCYRPRDSPVPNLSSCASLASLLEKCRHARRSFVADSSGWDNSTTHIRNCFSVKGIILDVIGLSYTTYQNKGTHFHQIS